MEKNELLVILEKRFNSNMNRHQKVGWTEVLKRFNDNPEALKAVANLELSGGEPDLVSILGDFVYVDCVKESPQGRRSLCYDQKALNERKMHKPLNSALNLAKEYNVTMLTRDEYHLLQTVFPFDLKTSSWVLTPDKIRILGGALFCDRRYDQVFTYHNGADSYYASRGFRAKVNI